MRQNYVLGNSIIVVGEEFREGVIRQMPNPAHHPLLHRPWVWTRAQHFHVVIRFHQQYVAAAEVVPDARRHITQVGGKADLDSFRAKREAYRIGGIMWNREG